MQAPRNALFSMTCNTVSSRAPGILRAKELIPETLQSAQTGDPSTREQRSSQDDDRSCQEY